MAGVVYDGDLQDEEAGASEAAGVDVPSRAMRPDIKGKAPMEELDDQERSSDMEEAGPSSSVAVAGAGGSSQADPVPQLPLRNPSPPQSVSRPPLPPTAESPNSLSRSAVGQLAMPALAEDEEEHDRRMAALVWPPAALAPVETPPASPRPAVAQLTVELPTTPLATGSTGRATGVSTSVATPSAITFNAMRESTDDQ